MSKILIVEDELAIAELEKDYLELSGFDVEVASDGQVGLKKALTEDYDLIILDLMLPGIDGYQVCREIRAKSNTPIIMLSAKGEVFDKVLGLELGADDYIIKPFNPEILKTKVKRLIKNRQDLKAFYSQLINPQSEKESNADNRQKIAEELEQKDPFMSKLLGIIEDNISNKEFSVKKLADSMNVSQPTLYRRVKQATDYSIIELIRATRLKKAAELLKTHAHSISETAELVGYSDIPTFRKHFTEYYGATPSSFAPSHIQAEK